MSIAPPTYEQDTIEARTLGYRHVLGTEWPREAQLRRLRGRGGRRIAGYAVTVVCNGTADLHREFRTRGEALAYFEAL